jgi:DNA polymerase III epsilon subunit-like protein
LLAGVLFQSYIKPKVKVNRFAAEVHGITNKKLDNAPPAEIIIPSFLAFVGTSPLIACVLSFKGAVTRLLLLFVTNSLERLPSGFQTR